MNVVSILLTILTVLVIVIAVYIIEKMGANITQLKSENRALKIKVEHLEEQINKKAKRKKEKTDEQKKPDNTSNSIN